MSNFIASRMSDDNWATPSEVYQALDKEFHFNDDPCPLNPIDGFGKRKDGSYGWIFQQSKWNGY